MSTLLRTETRTARRAYSCGAFYWFDRSNYGPQDMEPGDWALAERVRAEGGVIKLGTQYMHQVSVGGGEFSELRCRLDMHDICTKYDLYPED